MLENKASSTMVTLVAALAGLELTGENAALRLLEPGAAASSDALVSDVFHALAAKGLHAAALRAYAKLPNPSERDKALRLLIAVERRDRNAAREALAALPPDFRKRPSVKAAQLWTDVQGDKTRAASAAEIKALSGQPRELDRVDAVVLYEAALLGGLSAEASAILADGLAKARFDAERINRFAEVLRRIQTDKNTLQILEDRLRVVDPTGKIRAPAPRPLDVD
jgi:hypothetical protein